MKPTTHMTSPDRKHLHWEGIFFVCLYTLACGRFLHGQWWLGPGSVQNILLSVHLHITSGNTSIRFVIGSERRKFADISLLLNTLLMFRLSLSGDSQINIKMVIIIIFFYFHPSNTQLYKTFHAFEYKWIKKVMKFYLRKIKDAYFGFLYYNFPTIWKWNVQIPSGNPNIISLALPHKLLVLCNYNN